VEEAALNEVPPLPKRPNRQKWRVQVVEWWGSLWRSPMASEYLDADIHVAYLVAELRQLFYDPDVTATERRALAAEIRQQEARLGASPIDRRRLQWEVEKAESAAERTKTRRQRQRPETSPADPRDVLKVV
jgi:hypothetical protein